MKKTIHRRTELRFKQAFPGLQGADMMAHQYPIEPMLVCTEFHMNQSVFGPHPHAGISVMTYMLPDSQQGFINRDSLGDFSYIEPGGLHISQAGSGMFHDEFPRESGIDTHGFQLWINHKQTDRWVTPKSMHANADEIVEVSTADYNVRIIHGEFNSKCSPYSLVTDITILHVTLQPNSSMVFDAKEMAFAYGLRGVGYTEDIEIKPQTMLNFSTEGDQVEIRSSEGPMEFIFCTAAPLHEHIVYGGPFVMTTREQMQLTQERLARGEMGNLEPYTV